MTAYYKCLKQDNTGGYSDVAWHLPKGSRPGKWMLKLDANSLSMCACGYHVVTREQIIPWLAPKIYEAQIKGRVIESHDKLCAQQARLVRRVDGWNDYTARMFAADCAANVLHIFEDGRRNDTRPRKAIRVARLFAVGKCDAAAWAAAWAAARDAARSAADAAARAWQAKRLWKWIDGTARPLRLPKRAA